MKKTVRTIAIIAGVISGLAAIIAPVVVLIRHLHGPAQRLIEANERK